MVAYWDLGKVVVKNRFAYFILLLLPNNMLFFRYIWIIFSIMLLTISTILLMIFDSDQSGLNLLFETTSAFSTTGLSAIGSGNLSAPSKIVLILLMYIGRVGPISFILTLNSTYGSKGKNMTLPEGKVMVG